MSERIHPGWLQPTPRYWHDFAYGDEPRLEDDYRLPNVNPEGERNCAICGEKFEPKTRQGSHRKVCYGVECESERKRRNRLISARRVAKRKALQA